MTDDDILSLSPVAELSTKFSIEYSGVGSTWRNRKEELFSLSRMVVAVEKKKSCTQEKNLYPEESVE